MSYKFQIIGDSLSGQGLSFDVAALIASKLKLDAVERGKLLVEVVEAVYREVRASALLTLDDRFNLHGAVDTLRALSVVVGPTPRGDRHGAAADILARLLQEQECGA